MIRTQRLCFQHLEKLMMKPLLAIVAALDFKQGGIRPVLVVQNDVGNKYSPTIIAAAVTSKINKAKLPTHIELPSAYGLAKDSVILLEQIRIIQFTAFYVHNFTSFENGTNPYCIICKRKPFAFPCFQ